MIADEETEDHFLERKTKLGPLRESNTEDKDT